MNEKAKENKSIIMKALLKNNPILVSGMIVAPVIAFVDSFYDALTLIVSFSIITFFTLLLSSFIPHNIVYTVRIILYTLIGALVFVPTYIILNMIIPNEISAMGIYFPILITNSLILSKSETMFLHESKLQMILDIIFTIIGYSVFVLIFGIIREIISYGELGGYLIPFSFVVDGVGKTYGGFILLGMLVAVYRMITIFIKKLSSRSENE